VPSKIVLIILSRPACHSTDDRGNNIQLLSSSCAINYSFKILQGFPVARQIKGIMTLLETLYIKDKENKNLSIF
jgi:hypothetical protein